MGWGWKEMAREMNEQDPEGTARLLGGAWVGTPGELREGLADGELPEEGIITPDAALDAAARISAGPMIQEIEVFLREK